MDDAANERLRLDRLHHEELLRITQTQEQERRHLGEIQARQREHHRMMLDLDHDAAIKRQKALNEQEYKHRESLLELESQYALTGSVFEPRESVPKTEKSGSRNEVVAMPRESVLDSENAGPGDEAAVESKQRLTRKADQFTEFASRAKEREVERTRGK